MNSMPAAVDKRLRICYADSRNTRTGRASADAEEWDNHGHCKACGFQAKAWVLSEKWAMRSIYYNGT